MARTTQNWHRKLFLSTLNVHFRFWKILQLSEGPKHETQSFSIHPIQAATEVFVEVISSTFIHTFKIVFLVHSSLVLLPIQILYSKPPQLSYRLFAKTHWINDGKILQTSRMKMYVHTIVYVAWRIQSKLKRAETITYHHLP